MERAAFKKGNENIEAGKPHRRLCRLYAKMLVFYEQSWIISSKKSKDGPILDWMGDVILFLTLVIT